MTVPVPTRTRAAPPHLLSIRTAVEDCLAEFLAKKANAATDRHLPPEIVHTLRDFLLAGGKRLRPLLCACGWYAASGGHEVPTLVRVAASLEMFHTFCLIHDDVMDSSTTRRGRPTVHTALAKRHANGHESADAARLGSNAAIIVGDLALAWSDELLHTAHLTPVQFTMVLPLIDEMRSEVSYGQYLDLTSSGHPTADVERALTIARYKTAKYTCERPLHIGAALAGADEHLLQMLSAFALPLGEGFQLRDDLLGAFGRPEQTGKPAIDDLREGKHTVLAALAMRAADASQRRLLRNLYGNAHLDEGSAAKLRAVLQATGANRVVESMLDDCYARALNALEIAALPPDVSVWLRELAEQAIWRAS